MFFALGHFLYINFSLIKSMFDSYYISNLPWDTSMVGIYINVMIFVTSTIAIWLFLHTKYSFIPIWQMESLVRRFTEESKLLQRHDSDINETQSVRWIFHISHGEYYLELRAGGHVDVAKENDIPRRFLGFLVKETDNNWYLEDSRITDGKIRMIFSHNNDERLLIDSLNNLSNSELLNVRLTKRLFWTVRQPMGLIVGPTGTGKTSLLKTLIIGFLANNPDQNEVYCIDGKASFLSVAMKRVGKVATNGEDALALVTELEEQMEHRYEEMNQDYNSESDVTHVEKHHRGNILLVADELLALVTTMQMEDKKFKPAERLYPQFIAKLLNLIVKGRQASIFVLVSGQMLPTTILPSEARDSLGLRIALGRLSQAQATEIFNISLSELPRVDTSDFGGLIWLDGMDWEGPKEFKSPKYNNEALPFKSTLSKLVARRVGQRPTLNAATTSSLYLTNSEDVT